MDEFEDELDEESEEPESEEPSELEPDELLAVGVDEEVVSVSVELESPELDDEPLEVLLLVLLCVASGTVAATASDPAIPLTATIAVIVAVRALPCRTERAASSATSMTYSVKGCYRSVTAKLPAADEKIMNTAWAPPDSPAAPQQTR